MYVCNLSNNIKATPAWPELPAPSLSPQLQPEKNILFFAQTLSLNGYLDELLRSRGFFGPNGRNRCLTVLLGLYLSKSPVIFKILILLGNFDEILILRGSYSTILKKVPS